MNRFHALLLSIASVLPLACLASTSQAGTYEKYLSADEVKTVAGMDAVTLKPEKDTEPLKFTNGGGSPILSVRFATAKTYNKEEAKKIGIFKESLSGIGEDAFSSPSADPQYSLYFKKGPLAVTLTAFYNANSKSGAPTPYFFTIDQLKELAKRIASKI